MALARFLLSAAAAGGVDARRLAREVELPSWVLSAGEGFIDSRHVSRIWELTEHALGGEDAALAVARHYRMGALDLYDYLFASAATLGEGLAASQRYMHLVTTNSGLEAGPETEGLITYSFRHAHAGDRRTDLAQQCAVVLFCDRARTATGQRLVPVRVGLAHPGPRSVRRLREALGTGAIEFDSPVTSFTFRAEDLELPLRTGDHVLAAILGRYAESLPRPRTTWLEQFRQCLAEAIGDGAPSMEEVARRMAVSTRTLQRRLADRGTTWRAELDSARQRRVLDALQSGTPTMASLAAKLGYRDARSVSRVLHRLDNHTKQGATPPRRDQADGRNWRD